MVHRDPETGEFVADDDMASYLNTQLLFYSEAWNPEDGDNNFDDQRQGSEGPAYGKARKNVNFKDEIPDRHAVALHGIEMLVGDPNDYEADGTAYAETWFYSDEVDEIVDDWSVRVTRDDIIAHSNAGKRASTADNTFNTEVVAQQIRFPKPVLIPEYVGIDYEGKTTSDDSAEGEIGALAYYDIVGPLDRDDYLELLMER